jgi:hypothetical protein
MFITGKLNAAKATLETNRLPIRLLIFMIPDPPLRVLIGDWAALTDSYAECGTGRRSSPPATAQAVRFVVNPAIFRRLLCTRYATSAGMF